MLRYYPKSIMTIKCACSSALFLVVGYVVPSSTLGALWCALGTASAFNHGLSRSPTWLVIGDRGLAHLVPLAHTLAHANAWSVGGLALSVAWYYGRVRRSPGTWSHVVLHAVGAACGVSSVL